jgi:hypothetical protein
MIELTTCECATAPKLIFSCSGAADVGRSAKYDSGTREGDIRKRSFGMKSLKMAIIAVFFLW